jgi:NAD+ synthase (glutamine-hydrolysing)
MPLSIAIAQVDPCAGDLAGNSSLIADAVRDAGASGARLVLLPEMVLPGYPVEDLALRGSFRDAAARALTDLATTLEADGLGGVTVVVGTLGTSADGRPQNAAAVLHGGAVTDTYVKHHLPTYGVFDEFRIFAAGDDTTVISVDGHRLGLAICEDIWRDGGPVSRYEGEDLDALLVLNGSPFEAGMGLVREDLAATLAARLRCPVLYANIVGGQDDLVFDGQSFATDAVGRVVARAAGFTPDRLLVSLGDQRALTAAEDALAEPLDTIGQMYSACVLGLKGYMTKNGFTSAILGLSGGIDSALCAAIAADAVGGENVVGISMPSSYSSQHSKDDAADTAAAIGLDYRTMPIAPMVETFRQNVELTGVAEENLQARVRGVTLMGISNMEGHLVLATGNKSELAVGYSTSYGDAVGGFAPIKDVLKTAVWEVSRWRNAQAEAAGEPLPIPVNSIVKPPSAELRPGQQDSDSLPEYDLLDAVIRDHVEHSLGRTDLVAAGHDPEVVDRVLTLVDRAEWKRRQYPLGPKVTALAFGRDRRLPVTTRWRETA